MIRGTFDAPSLSLAWAEVPWDSALFGFPVLHIERLECREPSTPEVLAAFAAFEQARDAAGCRFASCRVPAEEMTASLLLQERGFRVVEMLFHPELKLHTSDSDATSTAATLPALELRPASAASLPELEAIAGGAFGLERFHVDPRVPQGLGDQRYRNWVRSALEHPRQRLIELREGGRLVAFFVTELLPDGCVYWHLNAVAPAAQGRGIGPRAWATMIQAARDEGASHVRSAIVARNVRVMNLYARFGFRFLPPKVGLHWAAA